MVIHCTLAVETPNSVMSAGKAIFMAVSTTTPAKDMTPMAIMESTSRASRCRWKPVTKPLLGVAPGPARARPAESTSSGPAGGSQR